MKEAERVELYNDLCDFEQELMQITFPPQTRKLDIIHRAIVYVKGERAKWESDGSSVAVLDGNGRMLYLADVKCSACGFRAHSDYKFCPNCRARMK